jgi:hypothetical protein
MGKIFPSYSPNKGLISRIYRELKKPNPQRINIPMKKWAQELNKEEVQMATKYIKKCSISLAIKEIQIKTTLRFHLIPMTIFKGNNNNKFWGGCGKTDTLIHC